MEVGVNGLVGGTAVTSGARGQNVGDRVIIRFVHDDHVRIFYVKEVLDVGRFCDIGRCDNGMGSRVQDAGVPRKVVSIAK